MAKNRPRRPSSPSFGREIDPELIRKARVYLEGRTGHAAPDPDAAAAWDELFRIFSVVIQRSLASWKLGEQDRDDCTQEVWIEVLRHLRGMRGGALPLRLGAWLTILARNKAADLIRCKYRRATTALSDKALATLGDPHEAEAAVRAERELARLRVRRAVAALARRVPATNFRLFYLHWYRGRTLTEVAGPLGLTPAQARFRHHRVTRAFRGLLAQMLADPPRRGEAGSHGAGRRERG